MNYRIICVGKVKEPFYREQIQEYIKEIHKKHQLQIIEVEDEKTKEHMSEAERSRILDIEGRRILQALSTKYKDYVVPLCIDGKTYQTEQWSRQLRKISENGEYEQITYVIGGSLGLSNAVVRLGDEKISYSALTFPHQLIRVMLLEQILICDKADHK